MITMIHGGGTFVPPARAGAFPGIGARSRRPARARPTGAYEGPPAGTKIIFIFPLDKIAKMLNI